MKTLITVAVFFMLCSTAWSGDYVCFDGSGTITAKYMSISGQKQREREDCIQITRSQYSSLTPYFKVENLTIRAMTQEERDIYDAAISAASNASQVQAIEDMSVSVNDAFVAFLTVYNSKIQPPNQITRQEVINQIKLDKGL